MTEQTGSSTGVPLAPLRPIKRLPTSPASPQELPLDTGTSSRLSHLAPLPTTSRRTLDFDVETVSAGYADPNWVPSHVTAYAFSWIGEKKITVDALPIKDLFDRDVKAYFIQPLLTAIAEADVVTGHNIIRFDLPILMTETMRLGLPTLNPVLVQDTIRLPRTKGFKKGQDNLGVLLETLTKKKSLNWEEWDRAYGDPNSKVVKERVRSDVKMHKEIREEMRIRGWLMAPRLWKP